MDAKKVLKEHRRLKALLKGAEVPPQRQAALEAVIDNLAFMRIKLDEAREEMQEESLIDTYQNGENQSGTRESPYYKSYLNLWRGYLAGLEKLQAYLPKEAQEETVKEPVTVLAKVVEMRKKAKA